MEERPDEHHRHKERISERGEQSGAGGAATGMDVGV